MTLTLATSKEQLYEHLSILYDFCVEHNMKGNETNTKFNRVTTLIYVANSTVSRVFSWFFFKGFSRGLFDEYNPTHAMYSILIAK